MCCRHCSLSHGTSSPRHVGLPASAPRRARRDPVLLPALLLRATTRFSLSRSAAIPRAAAVAEIERELLELYRDPELAEKPKLLEQRGGAFYSEAATGLVASLASGSGEVHEVDLRNDGTHRRARRRRRRRGACADDRRRLRSRSPSLRSRPSCSASSSTSQPTSGSPSRRHSAATLSTRARHCSRTR